MKAKLGAIFLMSMIALAGTGAAYALWFEDLYIYTDIHTGNVDVEWSTGIFWSNQTKDISTGLVTKYADSPNILRCFVWDAYPCVQYRWYFDVHCVGSIPVHFTPFVVEAYSNLSQAWIQEDEILIYAITLANGTYVPFQVPIPLWTLQLHQGEIAWGYFMIHFNNNLPQNDYFVYDFHMQAYQYNEPAPIL
jgi:hypothetical protein